MPNGPSLLRNRGDGTFEDVTAAAGLMAPIASHSGAWADYDNDGFVDLYMVGEINRARPDPRDPGRLYHNNGDGDVYRCRRQGRGPQRPMGQGSRLGRLR